MTNRTVCLRCKGEEVEWVTERYLDRHAPWPDPPPEGSVPSRLAEHDAQVEVVRLRRASLANSCYPCRECQPGPFFRWAGRHWEVGHDISACNECQDVRRGKPLNVEAKRGALADAERDPASARKDVN